MSPSMSTQSFLAVRSHTYEPTHTSRQINIIRCDDLISKSVITIKDVDTKRYQSILFSSQLDSTATMSLTNIVLPLLLTYFNKTPTYFEEFINTMIDEEHFTCIQIVKDGSVEIPDNIFHISKGTPNVIMDMSKPVNFLSHRFRNETLLISLYARTIFILFLESPIIIEKIRSIHYQVEFPSDSRIIIVLPSSSTDNDKLKYAQAFYEELHINVLVLDLDSFEKERKSFSTSFVSEFGNEAFDNN